MRLGAGSIVKMRNGNQVKVIKASDRKVELGEGGQGYVYLVEDTITKKRYALKWYKEQALESLPKDSNGNPKIKAFHENLCRLSDKGAPHANFLWPIDVTQILQGKCYGYIMPLREERFVELTSVLNVDERFSDLRALCRACENIADAFRILHRHGYSYQDLNAGGIFIDLKTGDISVCDCDNVAPDGENITGIKGFPGFMAPEVLLGKAQPSRGTDYHSLAVTLFYLTMLGHPLEGANECRFPVMNSTNGNRLYGSSAVFIYDPDNSSNRPQRGIHPNVIALWDFYPKYIRDLFTKAFSHRALSCSPDEAASIRVKDMQWKAAFANLRNLIVSCPNCKRQIYLDMENTHLVCKHCGKRIPRIGYLKLGNDSIPVVSGRDLTIRQLVQDCPADEVIGRFEENPSRPGVVGLRNLSSQSWAISITGQQQETLAPGAAIALCANGQVRPGVQIEISHQALDGAFVKEKAILV